MRKTSWVLLVLVAGCGKQQHDEGPPPPGGGPAPVPVVKTVKLQRQKLQRVIEQPAQVEAYAETALIARLPGAVGKIHVDIGQRLKGPERGRRGQVVTPGDILAELPIDARPRVLP